MYDSQTIVLLYISKNYIIKKKEIRAHTKYRFLTSIVNK